MPDLHSFKERFVVALDSGPALPLSPIAVYRNTSLSGAIDALADNFPVVRELIGDALFEALAVDHVRECPPTSPVLALYGEEFAGWLARQPIAVELTYLADVARCERLHVETLFAHDAPPLVLPDLGAVHPDKLARLRPKLHPAVRFDWLATPAMHIWLAHQDDMPDDIAIDWRPGGALFCRPYIEVAGLTVDSAAHRLLCGIRLGETLGEAAEAARSLYPEADIGTRFAELVNAGAFAALSERS